MKESLQRKIKEYRHQKQLKPTHDKQQTQKMSFHHRAQQATNNLQKLMESATFTQENYDSTNKKNHFQSNVVLDYKQKQYFDNLQRIHEAKMKEIQLNNTLQQLKLEINLQSKNLQQLQSQINQQKQGNHTVMQQILSQHEKQKQDVKKIFEERIGRNLQHLEQLLSEKQKQNLRKEQFIQKKRKFEELVKKQKENYTEQLKKHKDIWAQAEKQKRDKWEQNKTEEIRATTLKGIEPNIQRIVKDSKNQIKNLENRFDILKQQFRDEKQKQFENYAKSFKQQTVKILQEEKHAILSDYRKRVQNQYQKLESQFQEDREKMRNSYSEDIRKLQHERKAQIDDFIRKNKYFYVQHLNQVRQIKQQHQKSIKELENTVNIEVQKQQIELQAKYEKQFNEQVQQQKKKLRKRLEQFTKKIKKQCQEKYEDLVEKVACENNSKEQNLINATNERLQALRQQSSSEIKSLSKTIKALQMKLENQQQDVRAKQSGKHQLEQQYLQAKRENQYLMRKRQQLTIDLKDIKAEYETLCETKQSSQLRRVQQRWSEQHHKLYQKLDNLQKQISAISEIMLQRIEKNQLQKLGEMNKMQSEVIKLNNRRDQQIVKIKMQKSKLQQLKQSYQNMLEKQAEMIKKYKKQ